MSKSATKLRNQQEVVEEMGVFFEASGLAPMPGRVFAFLLLAEPPYKDFYEIQEFLKASKSAISNALKHLMGEHMVKYITFSGDRRRYFQVDLEGWMESVQNRIKSTAHFNSLISNVLENRKESKHPLFNDKLKSMSNFYIELGKVMDAFMDKWNKENN